MNYKCYFFNDTRNCCINIFVGAIIEPFFFILFFFHIIIIRNKYFYLFYLSDKGKCDKKAHWLYTEYIYIRIYFNLLFVYIYLYIVYIHNTYLFHIPFNLTPI